MTPRKMFDGSRLIRCVVINMHIWISRASQLDLLDELDERPLLRLRVEGPDGFVDRLPFLRDCYCADEILEALIECERIAFEVEKQITGGRSRQCSKTSKRFGLFL